MSAKELLEGAFPVGRLPRSPEYKAGLLTLLEFRLDERKEFLCPHSAGSTAFDAWFAGVVEGKNIFDDYKKKQRRAK